MRGPFLGIVLGLTAGILAASPGVRAGSPPSDAEVVAAFGKQGIRLSGSEAAAIRDDVRLALQEARAHGIGNSKVDFAAVEIASRLGLDTSPGSNTVRNVVAAIRLLLDRGHVGALPAPPPKWSRYFDRSDTQATSLPQDEPPEGPWNYFGGKYYRKIWTGYKNWDESRSVCQKEGGDLAVVNNKTEFDYLSDLCGRGHICRLGHRSQGGYCSRPYDNWIDGTPWSYENWSPGEPMFFCGEDCLDINVDGKMNNEWCDNHWNYSKFSLCEAKKLPPSDRPR